MSLELFKVFGPWAMGLVGGWILLKYLVTDKLKQIMAKLEQVDRHESDITKIKTAMEINGCFSAHPACRHQPE